MKLRHFLYDLTDVLLLHLILNIPGRVVELLPFAPHGALVVYLLGVAWAIVQLVLGVRYRERILLWWEGLPSPAVWAFSAVIALLFLLGLAEEVMTHGWRP